MSVTVRIPTQLRELSGGASEVAVEGATVQEVLANLDAAHEGFAGRLFADDGQLRRFVNVFLADEDIRFLDGLSTEVAEGQTVSIVPAVAGGAGDGVAAGGAGDGVAAGGAGDGVAAGGAGGAGG